LINNSANCCLDRKSKAKSVLSRVGKSLRRKVANVFKLLHGELPVTETPPTKQKLVNFDETTTVDRSVKSKFEL
jgi:hypothetical protein